MKYYRLKRLNGSKWCCGVFQSKFSRIFKNCLMQKTILSAIIVFGFIAFSLVSSSKLTPLSATETIQLPTPSPAPVVSLPQISPTPTPSSAPTSTTTPTPTPLPTKVAGRFRDGSYDGETADAFYGNVKVRAIISGGKLTDVQILETPTERDRSIEINSRAMPILRQEAIRAQSGSVDTVSGATYSSEAFIQSLTSALNKAS